MQNGIIQLNLEIIIEYAIILTWIIIWRLFTMKHYYIKEIEESN